MTFVEALNQPIGVVAMLWILGCGLVAGAAMYLWLAYALQLDLERYMAKHGGEKPSGDDAAQFRAMRFLMTVLAFTVAGLVYVVYYGTSRVVLMFWQSEPASVVLPLAGAVALAGVLAWVNRRDYWNERTVAYIFHARPRPWKLGMAYRYAPASRSLWAVTLTDRNGELRNLYYVHPVTERVVELPVSTPEHERLAEAQRLIMAA